METPPVQNPIVIGMEGTLVANQNRAISRAAFFWSGDNPPPDVWKELCELRSLVQKQAKQLEEQAEQIKKLWYSPGMPGYNEAAADYHKKRCE